MMKRLRNRAKSLYRTLLIPAVHWRTAGWRVDATGRQLAAVMRSAVAWRTSAEEKPWLERIESLRSSASASTAPIRIMDYGAGSPDGGLTEHEMYEGRTVSSTVGELCRGASKPAFWSRLLFRLVREFEPVSCVELGTCLGISAAYQAAALKLNGRGRLVTLEGSPASASLAEQHLAQLDLENVSVVVGRFQDTLDGVLRERAPIDYAFIDGHHDESATIAYFEQVLPFLAPRAVLVFDDISWSEGMSRAWEAIRADHHVSVSLDLGLMGICVVDRHGGSRQRLDLGFVA